MAARGNTHWSKRSRPEGRKPRGTDNTSENKWGFAFCFLFTNQAGTVIYSFSGLALIITTMLYHWYAPSLTSTGVRALQNLLLHTYFLVMMVGFIMAFVAAYNEKGGLAKVAALLVLIGTVLYFIFFVMSFFTDSMLMLYVCPEMRCADHHWLQDAMWRGYVLYSENIERYRNLEKEISKIEDKISCLIKEELASNDFNVSNRYPFLQDGLLKTYPQKKKLNYDSIELEAENQTKSSIDIFQPTTPQERKGQYIRVLDSGNEKNTVLIVLSVLFGIMIIVYFAYAILTFYAYVGYIFIDSKDPPAFWPNARFHDIKSETFCFIFSLQSGAVMSVMVLSALGITSLVNIIYYLVTSSTFSSQIVPFSLALVYLIVLGAGVILAFFGAYNESTFWMVIGGLFTGIAILIYIVITTLSFLPSMYSTTCISLRCPEQLWLQQSYWRNDASNETEIEENGGNAEEELIGTNLESTESSMNKGISRRRQRPIPRAHSSKRKQSSSTTEEEGQGGPDIDGFLCEKRGRKFAADGDEYVEYCPPDEREAEDGEDSGIRAFSAIISILYFLCFVAFQLYCLYGFLCFANELKKEMG